MDNKHNPLQENSYDRGGVGFDGAAGRGSGFADGDEAGFNFDGAGNEGLGDNMGTRNDGLDFNTNRFQRPNTEEERRSLVNNPPVKQTNGPSDPNALK